MTEIKTYKEVEYLVRINEELGNFCGYVKLPKNHHWIKLLKPITFQFAGRKYKDRKYDEIPVKCHGGLTFGHYFAKPFKSWTKGYWIGWDYAHLGDYIPGILSNKEDNRIWTEKEVEDECFRVIDQLLKAKKEMKL